ncbi:MAG: AtzG-like protein [Acetobacter sp.]|uniref:AtzG-like protein n=1 Tax=unclassified Acetobacter TaxID=2628570 RepID=UPI0025C04FDE|nr:AtzG-like protein [Acetobacter sp. UBA5411]
MQSDTEQETSDLLAEARRIRLTIPDACLPGVTANSRLLQTYIDLVLELELPDNCPPAYEYEP